jgi:hypothetical protein
MNATNQFPRDGHWASKQPSVVLPAYDHLSTRQQHILTLQHRQGNAAVCRTLANCAQRELAAYSSDHTEVEPRGFMEVEDGEVTRTSDGDGPEIEGALKTLIDDGKIGVRYEGGRTIFSDQGATHEEIEQALLAIGYKKPSEMATALLEDHRITLFTEDELRVEKGWFGLDSELEHNRDKFRVDSRRHLTAAEINAVSVVFGSSINYNNVILEDDWMMSLGFDKSYARTTPGEINFPPGTISDNKLNNGWLVHEMAHIWQYNAGLSILTTGYHAIKGNYDYGGEERLREVADSGGSLKSFNTEQQADIARD